MWSIDLDYFCELESNKFSFSSYITLLPHGSSRLRFVLIRTNRHTWGSDVDDSNPKTTWS